MNEEKTDASLKSFIFAFKIHIDQFNEVVHELYQQITEGSKGIEQLFLQTNEQMWKEIEQQQKQLLDDVSSIPMEPDRTSLDHFFHLLQRSDVVENAQ